MQLSHYDTGMMKTKAKRILELIKADLKANYVLLITIFLAWLLIRWLTHAFCPSIIFCGLPCPGCGLTRAGKALMVLDFDAAWERNPSIYVWCVYLAAALFQHYFREKPLKQLTPLLMVVIAVTVGVYIYRMLYMFPGEPPLIYREENLLAHIHPTYDAWMKSHIAPPYR